MEQVRNGMKTFGQKFEESGCRSAGFDYMRFALATLIILFHSLETSYGALPVAQAHESLLRPFAAALLPMFFCLSGFLVAGSLERNPKIFPFAALRVLRIFPALALEVILSAVLLGLLFTKLPLRDYLTHGDFAAYFLNITGYIHYTLPGVFQSNPVPDFVNAQLWTVPWELYCYLLLIVMYRFGMLKRERWAYIVAPIIFFQFYFDFLGVNIRPFCVPGLSLIVCFVLGVLFYQYRARIPFRLDLFCFSFVLMVACLKFPGTLEIIAPLFVCYACLYLGLCNPKRDRVVLSGDYSYGLFLYGYAVQQAVAALGPAFHHWYINFLVAFPCALLFAAVSWWAVERPILGLRKYIIR